MRTQMQLHPRHSQIVFYPLFLLLYPNLTSSHPSPSPTDPVTGWTWHAPQTLTLGSPIDLTWDVTDGLYFDLYLCQAEAGELQLELYSGRYFNTNYSAWEWIVGTVPGSNSTFFINFFVLSPKTFLVSTRTTRCLFLCVLEAWNTEIGLIVLLPHVMIVSYTGLNYYLNLTSSADEDFKDPLSDYTGHFDIVGNETLTIGPPSTASSSP